MPSARINYTTCFDSVDKTIYRWLFTWMRINFLPNKTRAVLAIDILLF